MTGYLYALADEPGPQAIPPGFGGHHDWDAIDDTERARRGWVREDSAPVVNLDWERLVRTFAKDAGGVWTVSYSIVAGNFDRAMQAALSAVANRRWQAEVGGISLNGLQVPTDRETQAIVDRICKAFDDGDITGDVEFKSPAGFVTVNEPIIKAIKRAGAQHVQACFSRESDITALLMTKRKTETVRATLADELDKGWPA